MLLKIHGHVDRGGDARARELRRQRGRPHRLPRRRRRRRHRARAARGSPAAEPLLFLGYAVDDWSLRVFLRRVWGGDRLAYRSWAVQPAAEHVASELWRERGVEVYDVSLETYAEELARLTAALAGRGRSVMPASRRLSRGSPTSATPSTDWRFFFGRERESELVAANLMASRLTVLYGPSGVGKSSLLRAGVARRLRTLVPAVGGDGRRAPRS